MDALGWSHEAWTGVHNMPHGRQLLHELLLVYCTGGLGHEGEDPMNTSLIIPLFKDAQGTAIRPIAVPSAHRKVLAKVSVAAFRPELQRAAGDAQHAAMASDGTLRMAQTVQRHLHTGREDWARTQGYCKRGSGGQKEIEKIRATFWDSKNLNCS